MLKRLLLTAAAVWLNCMVSLAAADDVTCKGVLVNEVGEPIIGATITVPGTKVVTTTDIDGNFSFSAPKGKKVHINYIGYKPLDLEVASDLGQVAMDVASEMLQDVVVTQSIARTRKTPVAVSAVNAETLEIKLGNQELPEVLKTTPGVWATKDGGGFGDAKI
ncbi:carboxypeptidase-like regulatory domain-containing protein, partial [uncultured Duncaniella sp.]